MQVNLLLVDDEPGIVHAVRRLVHDDKYTIFEANDGVEALQIITEQRIDVLITDYQMPRCDGITLCSRVRQISPATYRLLLSGQVDYDILKQAWQRGDVHRFVAKPWDNLLLSLDIKEGIRQHRLLNHTHSMRHNLSNEQPVILLDNNWVIRLANSAFCDMLGYRENELLGQNLFSTQLSNVPVTQEAEVTRQVEDNQVWLGYFSFYTQQHNELPNWLALSQLGEQFRLGVCQFVNSERVTQGDPNQQIQDYAGGNEPAVCISGQQTPRIMLVECPQDEISSKSQSQQAYDAIKDICPLGCDIYHSPKAHIFLVLLPARINQIQQQELELTIETNLAFGPHQLPPRVSIEDKPNDIEDWEHWLRQRLGQPSLAELEVPSLEETDTLSTLPIFDSHGELIALETPQLGQLTNLQWRQWFEGLLITWQDIFSSPIRIMIDATRHNTAVNLDFLDELQRARTKIAIDCYILINEDLLLDESVSVQNWLHRLQQAGCSRLLNHFGRNFLNARQIANLPIDGISLAPEFLVGLQDPKSGSQSLRLLQKITDRNLLIYARNIDQTDLLATTHKAKIDWLSGSVLSNELTFDKLHWYSPEGQLG